MAITRSAPCPTCGLWEGHTMWCKENAAVPPAVHVSALDTQIGGGHYKTLAIQPMEYSMANKLDACQHTIIKYVTRFRDKGGIQDLEKALHTLEMLIEFERNK